MIAACENLLLPPRMPFIVRLPENLVRLRGRDEGGRERATFWSARHEYADGRKRERIGNREQREQCGSEPKQAREEGRLSRGWMDRHLSQHSIAQHSTAARTVVARPPSEHENRGLGTERNSSCLSLSACMILRAAADCGSIDDDLNRKRVQYRFDLRMGQCPSTLARRSLAHATLRPSLLWPQ